MRRDEILMIYGEDYQTMTKRLLCEAGLDTMIADKDASIGIKPNVLGPYPAENGGTTHPQIVAGIIEYLKEHGFHNLTIAEGSWVGDYTREAFCVCGYEDLAKQYEVNLLDTQQDTFYEQDCGGLSLHICDCVRQFDFLINVPVLKGHCQTGITCALKNMKGLIPNAEKRRFHRLGLHKPIAHLGLGIRQDFIVVDNICGDPNFEDGGSPFYMNRIFAAADPVLCDTFGAQVMGRELEEVPYLSLAEALGVGSTDLSRAHIRALNEPETLPVLPDTNRVMRVADKAEEVDSCSACYAYLIPALDMLAQEGLLDKLTDKVCIGQGYRGQTGTLGVGNCTCGFAHHLEGCPPVETEIYQFLKKYIDTRGERSKSI